MLDGEAMIVELLAERLRFQGFEVEVAGNGPAVRQKSKLTHNLLELW